MTVKQDKFIIEYLQCWNGTEAARRAGYAFPNTQGPRLLLDVRIQEKIQVHLAERTVSADEVLTRLGDQARGSIEDFIDILPNGHLAVSNLEKAEKAKKLGLIKKLKFLPKGGLEIELHDSQAALNLLGRHHGLFTDKVEHSGEIGIEYVNDWRTPSED